MGLSTKPPNLQVYICMSKAKGYHKQKKCPNSIPKTWEVHSKCLKAKKGRGPTKTTSSSRGTHSIHKIYYQRRARNPLVYILIIREKNRNPSLNNLLLCLNFEGLRGRSYIFKHLTFILPPFGWFNSLDL